tara:strand:- start:61 stop:837 length:777 start_codon:yes stop_codon:yes gene_type:complete
MPAYFSKNAKLNDDQKVEQAAEDARRNDEDHNQKVDKTFWDAVKALWYEEKALRKEDKAEQAAEDARWEKKKAHWEEVKARWKEVKACHFREYCDREGVDYYRSIQTNLEVSDNILTATINDDRWQIVNIYCATLPKCGTVNIYAKYREVDSTPRLRIFSAEENENSDWRKADQNGFSSAGGQGDGFSTPEVRSGMHPVDKEHFQHGEDLMATIDIENGHLYVQFHNWTEKFDLPFSTDCNSCIVVAFKGYSVKIVVE